MFAQNKNNANGAANELSVGACTSEINEPSQKRICIIVGASPATKLPQNFPQLCSGDVLLIAADGGYNFCKERGVVPNIVIADFDSLERQSFDENQVELHVLPQEKDDTDLIASCKEGLAHSCTTFYLYGVSGADEGHSIAAIQALNFLAAHNARGFICSNLQLMYLIKPQDGLMPVYALGECETSACEADACEIGTDGLNASALNRNKTAASMLNTNTLNADSLNESAPPAACSPLKRAPKNTRVSVFSFSNVANGVIERGLKWKLEGATLTSEFPLGVSNVVVSDDACIGVSEGTLLVIVGE